MGVSSRTVTDVRRWLRRFEGHVRAVDVASARTMFAEDVVSFGTYAAAGAGRPALERRQWARIWPGIRRFAFRRGDLRCLGGPHGVCVVVPWTSRGVRSDGTAFPRPGRATLSLVRRNGGWVALHSHFSLAPARGAAAHSKPAVASRRSARRPPAGVRASPEPSSPTR